VTDRPKRRAIPVRSKRTVVDRQGGLCICGCGQAVSEKPMTGTHFDHEPALRLRDVNDDGTDYIPPQGHPDFIDARCRPSHKVKTSGASRAAGTAGTDIGKIKKERKRLKRAGRPKRKWQSRGFDTTRSRKMSGKVVKRVQKRRRL
jgi:hypothetical protein